MSRLSKRTMREAAALAIGRGSNEFFVTVEHQYKSIIVNWSQSMIDGSEAWRKVEAAVRATLPDKYRRGYRVTCT